MKRAPDIRTAALYAGLAAVVAALLWGVILHRRLAAERGQSEWLKARIDRLTAHLRPESRARAELLRRLHDASNRAVRAAALYEEEKQTQDPLRRQIEALVEQGFRAEAERKQSAEQLTALTQAVGDARTKADSLERRGEELAARVQALETEKGALVDQLAEARAEQAAIGKARDAVTAELQAAKAEIGKLTAQVAAAEARVAELDPQLAAAQGLLKQTQAALVNASNELGRTQARLQELQTPPGQ